MQCRQKVTNITSGVSFWLSHPCAKTSTGFRLLLLLTLALLSGLCGLLGAFAPFPVSAAAGRPTAFPSTLAPDSVRPGIVPTRNVLHVGGDANYPPLEYLEDGVPKGFNVDLIRALAKIEGVDVEITLGPWAEMRQKLERGDLDALLGVAYAPEREPFYDFSLPHTYIYFDLFTRDDPPIRGLQDLSGRTVAVQQGGLMEIYLQRSAQAGSVLAVTTPLEALQAVLNGQADAALLNRMQGLYLIRQHALSGLKRIESGLPEARYAFAVREGNASTLALLNDGLFLLENNGSLMQLRERWFGTYETRDLRTLVMPYLYTAGGLAGLLLISLGVLWLLRRRLQERTAALQHSEKRYRTLVENATEGILVIAGEGHIVFANPMAAEILGQPLATLPGTPIAPLIHPEDRPWVMQRYQARLRGENQPSRYTLRIITARGSLRWLLIHADFIHWEGQPAVLAMFSDITERQEAEAYVSEKVRQLAGLRTIDMAITSGNDVSQILQIILQQVRNLLHMDAAAIWLLNPETRYLHLAASQGFHHATLPQQRSLETQDYAHEAVLKRRALFHLDLGEAHAPNGSPSPRMEGGLLRAEDFHVYMVAPLIVKDVVKGVLEAYHRSPLHSPPDLSFFEALSTQAAVAIEHARLFQELQRANLQLSQAYDATIEGWAAALELRDGSLSGHSRRVAEWSVRLAQALGITGDALVHIRRGALLHDIGKMAIPDAILQKGEDLTPEEWDIMKRHPEYALQFLSSIEFLKPALDIPYYHHERWDGSGYPQGLGGEAIPLAARIFAVVDVWDALRSNRSYHLAWSEEQILNYLQQESGRQFDPHVVEAFIRLVRETQADTPSS